jgi:hypothetical protein
MKRIKDAKNPLIANGDRREAVRSMSAILAAALAGAMLPAEALAAGETRRSFTAEQRRRFVADFNRRFVVEFEKEVMKRPDVDFKPGKAPWWLHALLDILWDAFSRTHFPKAGAPR